MMNYVWAVIVLISLCVSIFNKSVNNVSTELINSVENAVMFTIKLLGMFCFWGGLTNIAEKSGLTDLISRLLSPVLNLLFKQTKTDNELKKAITMNISANLLGIGNAATPLGLKAMNCFEKNPLDKHMATNDMIVFVVMNTAALRILPTTVAEIRNNCGAQNPLDILPVTLITSLCSLFVGLLLAKTLGVKNE